MSQRRAGVIQVQANGEKLDAKGNFSINMGIPVKEPIMGAGGELQGYKEVPQPGYIEGEITDSKKITISKLQNLEDATVTIRYGSGKVVMCSEAFYSHEGTFTTEEAAVPVKFCGQMQEV
tara:strand:- start:10921 stop:11280 length:360 start_codon:yes stop_codon:yes gene_type:complete